MCYNAQGVEHGYYYQGDNRSFDAFSHSYRVSSQIMVSAATASAVSTPQFLPGTIVQYADDALAADGYTLIGDSILNDCHLTNRSTAGSISTNVVVNGSGGA